MIESSAIAEYLNGTSRSVSDAASYFKVDEEQVLEALTENDVQECVTCGWWFPLDELSEDDNGELNCDDCCNR